MIFDYVYSKLISNLITKEMFRVKQISEWHFTILIYCSKRLALVCQLNNLFTTIRRAPIHT